MRLARVLGALGRVLITAGVLILLFVAYQLWGTGIREAQAQNRLEDEFAELVEAAPETTTTTTATLAPAPSTTTTSVADRPAQGDSPPAAPGDPVARIEIPAIGVDKIVVEGVSRADLKKGPGHYPETPLPGQEGNAAIAGHRTTYGAPFHRVDELDPGDEIIVETAQGRFLYLVREQRIVEPTQVEVLADTGRNTLTLTACHPRYSARERIVIIADMAPGETAFPPPAPRSPDDGTADATADGTTQGTAEVAAIEDLDGEDAAVWPTVAFGLLCAAIWLVAWLVGRLWLKWPAYLIGLPLFLVALFFFFEEFSRLVPASSVVAEPEVRRRVLMATACGGHSGVLGGGAACGAYWRALRPPRPSLDRQWTSSGRGSGGRDARGRR